MRTRDWEWPEICCNTCHNLQSRVPWDIPRGEAMKSLHYYCEEIKRKIEVEDVVNKKSMACKGEKHKKIERQCVATLKWSGSPHLKSSGVKMRCKRFAVQGTTICAVHGATPPKRIKEGTRLKSGAQIKNKMEYFKKDIKEKIEAFKGDPDLENLNFELGYLKSLLPRIEESDEISELQRFTLIEKVLNNVFKNMESRERIAEQRRYSLGLEKVTLLMKLVFDAVKKHVKDVNTIKAIGKEMQKIASQIKNTDNPLLEEPKEIEEDIVEADYEVIEKIDKELGKTIKKVKGQSKKKVKK